MDGLCVFHQAAEGCGWAGEMEGWMVGWLFLWSFVRSCVSVGR